MRRYFGVVVIVLAGTIVYAWWALSRPLPQLKPVVNKGLPAINQSATPVVSWPSAGQHAVGMVGQGVLATKGDQTPVPTASVAKVMLALVVLQKKPLKAGQQGPTITITPDDVAMYQQGLDTGQS